MAVVVDPHKLAYMPVPKAACSSVKAALAVVDPRVDHGREIFAADPTVVHRIYPTLRFRRHRWVAYHDFFRFTVIRDPLQRLLSVYSDLVAGRDMIRTARSFKRGNPSLPSDPDPDFFFRHLDEYAALVSVIKHHALPQIVFTGPKLERFSKVYRTAEIDALAADLSELTGTMVKVPRMNRSRRALEFSDLSPTGQAALRARLEPEYAHLAQHYGPIW